MGKAMMVWFAGLTVFFSVWMIALVVTKNRMLMAKRLDRIFSKGPQPAEEAALPKNKQKRSKQDRRWRKLNDVIMASGLIIKPSEFVLIWIFSALFPYLLFYAISGNAIVSIGFGLFGAAIPPLLLQIKKKKRLDVFEKQLAEALDIICNCLQSGLTFRQAIVGIARDMPDPIARELTRVVREVELGISLETALMHMAERLNSKNFLLIVSAIRIQKQTGGNLSTILSNIAGTIKDRYKLKNDIQVLTATGRMSGKVVGLMPICILLLLMLINPNYVSGFFQTSAGTTMMIVAAVSETLGFLWIGKITKIKY